MIYIIISILILLTVINLLIAKYITYEESESTPIAAVKFSLIIAARNEEANISNLLNAILIQDYDLTKLEIIIVDDCSIDNTFEVVNTFDSGELNLKIIKNDSGRQGKKFALKLGIEKAENEYIVITDADCIPEKKWLSEISRNFYEGNDMVFGLIAYKINENRIARYSSFHNLRSQLIVFTAGRMGFPYSAGGGSLAYRKSKYLSTNGFQSHLNIRSGDDDLLLQSFKKMNYKIKTMLEPGTRVFTEPVQSLKQFMQQKSRHVSTSNNYNFLSQLILLLWHSLNWISLFVVIVVPFNFILGILPLSKLLTDLLIVGMKQKYFNTNFKIWEILFFQIAYEFFLPVIYLKATFGKITWK